MVQIRSDRFISREKEWCEYFITYKAIDRES